MKHTHIHGFNPSSSYPDYEECEQCGSLHRIQDVAPFSIYEQGYWNRKGFSTIEEQVYNVSMHENEHGMTKIGSVLKYAEGGKQALELACAPGSLMVALRERYSHVTGIEIDPSYRDSIHKIINGAGALAFGKFPEVSRAWKEESFDFITGMDVLEHVEDGPAFLGEILRLLRPSGTVVLMAPFTTPDDILDPNQYVPEHVWIYSEKFLKEWFSEMFEEVITDKWISGHNIIVGRRKRLEKREEPETSITQEDIEAVKESLERIKLPDVEAEPQKPKRTRKTREVNA